jgi:hypothetical protein
MNKGTSRREEDHSLYHRYADCLLKNRSPNITNMLSIRNSSMLMISVSENFLVESECFFSLSKLLTCILSVVKTGLQSYCDTSYSKDMLEYIQSRSLSSCNSIKTIDLHVDDISFRELFGRIRVFFFYKIRSVPS